MKRALLIVDIQNDFLPKGALPVSQGDEVIPQINALQSLPFDLIVATKDWHPKNHLSFASVHSKKIGEVLLIGGHPQIMWPEHCVQNTYGSEFPPSLKTSKIHKIIYKGTSKDVDSYSAFFDNEHLHKTELDNFLKKNGILECVVAGLATDYCVKWSVFDAIDLRYSVLVALDACKGVNLKPNDEKNALHMMSERGAKILSCKEIEKWMKSIASF